MSVKISNFEPVTMSLFKKDESDEDWECPIPGMEDVWVRIMPPSWGVERDRQQFVNTWHNRPELSNFDVYQMEIALCYMGTNMMVLLPKRDEQGRIVLSDKDPGYETETVKFDANGQLAREEILLRVSKLPRPIVDAWHERTLEVATEWGRKF